MDLISQLIDKVYAKNGIMGAVTIIIGFAFLIAIWEIIKGISAAIANGKIAFNIQSKFPSLGKIFLFKSNDIDLTKHLIFAKYDLLTNKTHSAKVKCPLRKKIFQRLMIVRLQSHKDQSLQLIKEDFNQVDHDAFKILVMAFLAKSHLDWTSKALTLSLPDVVLSKIDDKLKDMRIFAETFICNVCDSTRFYENNIEKLSMILDLLAVLEESSVSTLEKVIDSMNGEVSKIEFEGTKCCNCDDECDFQVKYVENYQTFQKPIKRLLYVEDDKTMRDIISKVMAKSGVDVLVAKTIEEASKVIENGVEIDVVLVDYILESGKLGTTLEPMLKEKCIPFAYYTGVDPKTINSDAPIIHKSISPKDILKELHKRLII